MRKRIISFLAVLFLALGISVLGPSNPAHAIGISPRTLYNSAYSDGWILASPHFYGGAPSTRRHIPIGKKSGFVPTRSLYVPKDGCQILMARRGEVWDKLRGKGWHNLQHPMYLTGTWTAELWCPGGGGGSW